ncbi:C-type natriuretic protein [Citrobacter sp. S2-9]|uniref:C-type natriuretic protein n=1 Tax=Citrobacter enshiensis TaxID=2971264 RepID=A0ABT8PZJ7_9ENTR|nr:C-type natriuretic protein [Citrobacter enshiensis]MDN8601812.1 C-type natriuretic protein [Citrobacter enshiensis]
MSNLTSFDWWLATYLVAAGFGAAFYVGQLIVKLLLVRFANLKRIDDGLWRLGSLLEIHYGKLKENETITIQAKRFTATISRTPAQRGGVIKKLATERTIRK